MNQEQIRQVTTHDEKWVPAKKVSRSVQPMLDFWYTVKKVSGSNSYEFLLANKKYVVDAKVFQKILNICPRVQGVDFAEVLDDEATLTFLLSLGYKCLLHKHPNIRVVNKKVTITTNDYIIPELDVALELGKSISLTKAAEDEAARKVHASHARIVTEPVPEPARRRPSEQIIANTMKALKESKKTNRRQPDTRGSCEGTGVSPGVPYDSTVILATSSEGTDTKPGVADKEKVTSEDNVIIEWGSEQESEYTEKEDADEKNEWVDTNEEEKKKDDDDEKSIDLEHTDDEKLMMNSCMDEEMTNAEVDKFRNNDEEITDAAKVDAGKTEEPALEPSKIQTPRIDLEPESKKSASEIHKIKKEQAEKQKMSKYTIKSTDKAALKDSIELEYNMEECLKALTDRLVWNNLEGDRCPFDLTKPLPLKGHPGRLIVVAEYFFNNDLEILKSSDPEKKYTTSITKIKEARMRLWELKTWSLRFGKTFLEIEFKELYTPSYKPLGVIYEDLNKQKRVMRADELYKFSDGTLKTVRNELPHRILDFRLGYNEEMSRRKWTAIEKRKLELMVKLIDKYMRERRIIRNLERLVGARELEMDYRLMTRTE
nr:hypothetical protein [Tanacetum cinerariifolium]